MSQGKSSESPENICQLQNTLSVTFVSPGEDIHGGPGLEVDLAVQGRGRSLLLVSGLALLLTEAHAPLVFLVGVVLLVLGGQVEAHLLVLVIAQGVLLDDVMGGHHGDCHLHLLLVLIISNHYLFSK